MSLSKVPFLLSGALFTYIVWTPPNPPIKSSETLVKANGFEAIFYPRNLAFISKVCLFNRSQVAVSNDVHIFQIVPMTSFITEASFILFRNQLTTLAAPHVFDDHANSSGTLLSPDTIPTFSAHMDSTEILPVAKQFRLTPLFLLGWLILCLGTLIRLSCYRALGRFFTFELSVFNDHKLITTGPYAFVRHPSYTAFGVGVAGMFIMGSSTGSWPVESSIVRTWLGAVVFWAWFMVAVGTWMHFFGRSKTEDEYLRKQFGQVSSWDCPQSVVGLK